MCEMWSITRNVLVVNQSPTRNLAQLIVWTLTDPSGAVLTNDSYPANPNASAVIGPSRRLSFNVIPMRSDNSS